ncbi:POLYPROTEIN putative-RELATED [Salix purpurea]|uniref:POLYPROTEIN putative-RELATED n=1 Tax=Salix purpurea TaxID=77065 RepID=A0A9Q0UKY5_SALPP|nr:POLYPROTEIN putative-RELATED [Salix purpurea]
MPRGKLILICQSGGEFVTNDDGSLSYNGGEAHALDINLETMFDDLKLKLAEMCNLEYESLSMKYFIPGNKRTLITVSSDKDLKRMFDIHGNSITADVYVMGRGGFKREAYYMHASRASGIQLAETVLSPVPITVAPIAATSGNRRVLSSKSKRAAKAKGQSRVSSQLAVTSPTVTPATVASDSICVLSSKTANTTKAEAKSPASSVLAITSKKSSPTITEDPGAAPLIPTDLVTVPVDTATHDSVTVDMNASPADTVKKRRRTASWKIGANGPSIVLDDENCESNSDSNGDGGDDDDDDQEMRSTSRKRKMRTRKGTSWKKNTWDHDNTVVDVAIEWQSDCEDNELSVDVLDSKDVSVERMVASWKKRITGVGQDFKNVAEFRDALQKYSIARRFAYRLKKNDTNRASGRCVVDGCSWRIHASWVESEQVFRIKKMNKSHTCGGESWKHATPNKNWLVSIIKDRLRQMPRQKPRDIVNGLFQDFGMELNYSQVWRGIEDAKEQLQGSKKEAYNLLPWFCEKIEEVNPGSFVKLSIGDDCKFQRLFVSFHASIYGFQNGCRPILFLDSITLKSKYHEILLTATALDGDDGFFPVSFAIVDIENGDNWNWFLEQLKHAISTSRSVTFVSDKEKGLMKSVLELFENAHHGYSIYHLLENLRRNWKGPFHGDGKVSLPGSLVAAAHAVRLDGFRMHTEQIKRVSSKVYDWLMQIEPEFWTNALFKGEHYNHITVDVAATYADWIEEVRELPITRKLEVLTRNITDLIHTCQRDSNCWTTKLTPSKEKKLQEDAFRAQFLKVLFSTDTLFEVHDDSIHVVDTEKRECTCLEWKLTGLPCRHAIAVFKCKGSSVYDYCSKYYTVDSFCSTYSKPILPILDNFNNLDEEKDASESVQVLPPTTPRPPIQPEEKRYYYRKGEPTRVMSCSRCKGEGHNKATCKQPAQPLEHTTTPAPALALDAPALALDAPALALDAPALALDAPVLALDAPVLALDAPALALDAPVLALDAPALALDASALDAPALALDAPVLALDAPAPGARDPTLIAEPLEHEEPTLIEPFPGSPSSAKVP